MPITDEQANRLIAMAMIDAQVEATQAGDPDAAADEVAGLAAVGRDPDEAAHLFAEGSDTRAGDARAGADVELANPPGHRQMRAPKGGIVLRGLYYIGGQYIPKEVLAELSSEEMADVEAGRGLMYEATQNQAAKAGQVATRQADTKGEGEGQQQGKVIVGWELFGSDEDTLEAVYLEQKTEGEQPAYRWVARRDRTGLIKAGSWGSSKEAAIKAGRAYAAQAMS